MCVPLAGGAQKTLLDDAAPALLPFFTTRDACALRLVCREFLAAATEHPWEDRGTAIQGFFFLHGARAFRAHAAQMWGATH